MGSLDRAWVHTTALVGREVKRTFSEFGRVSTGLPGRQTREAGGQNFGDFDQVVSRILNGHAPLNGYGSRASNDFT
jgi:hypothetical protein